MTLTRTVGIASRRLEHSLCIHIRPRTVSHLNTVPAPYTPLILCTFLIQVSTFHQRTSNQLLCLFIVSTRKEKNTEKAIKPWLGFAALPLDNVDLVHRANPIRGVYFKRDIKNTHLGK